VLSGAHADLEQSRGNVQDYTSALESWYETKVLQDQIGLKLRLASYELLRAIGRLDLLLE
jgi:hypothetical protein